MTLEKLLYEKHSKKKTSISVIKHSRRRDTSYLNLHSPSPFIPQTPNIKDMQVDKLIFILIKDMTRYIIDFIMEFIILSQLLVKY